MEPTSPAAAAMAPALDTAFSRRSALRAVAAGGALVAAPVALAAPASASVAAAEPSGSAAPSGAPLLWRQPEKFGAPPVQGLHLTFGATRRVRWSPRGSPTASVRQAARRLRHAATAASAERHAGADPHLRRRRLRPHGLRPPRRADAACAPTPTYIYAGAARRRDARRGHLPHRAVRPRTVHLHQLRRPVRARRSPGPARAPAASRWIANCLARRPRTSSPASRPSPPLFHLLNGDLCYANLDVDRVRTWNNFFTNNTRSARFRPWMPAAGNHEIEKGNGPIGLGAFQTYFGLPSTETDADSPVSGTPSPSARCTVIVLQNDDNACRTAATSTSAATPAAGSWPGWRRTWPRRAARRDIDWIVVACTR